MKNNSEDANNVDIPLSAEEEQFLEGYLNDALADQVPDLGEINDQQAERLLKYVRFLESTLLDSQGTFNSTLLHTLLSLLLSFIYNISETLSI